MRNHIFWMAKLTLLFMTFNAYAMNHHNDIDMVYRVDKRHFSDVFKNGFKAWGYGNVNANTNVADHVSGRSCTLSSTSRNTAFISTSASLRFIQSLAANISSKLKKGEYITIYSIHPDINFYEAYRSLVWLSDNSNYHVSPNEFLMAVTQDEWIAFNNIDNTSIESATVYIRDENSLRIEEHINPYYIFSIDRTVNFQPFTNFRPSQPRREWRIWLRESVYPLVTQCFNNGYLNSTSVYISKMPFHNEYSSELIAIRLP